MKLSLAVPSFYISAISCVLLSCLTPKTSFSEIITSSRMLAWQGNVGVAGGIPNRTTIYQTIPAGASAATVQSALNNCPSNQVVQLSAGAYSFGGSNLDWANVRDGVVLRGAGPGATTITFSTGQILMRAGSFSESAMSVEANISVDAVKGSDTLTVASVPSWVTVGALIGVDQLDDPSFVAGAGTEGGQSYRQIVGNGARGLAQLNRVVSKTATTITLELPLFYSWKTSQTAQIFQPAFNPATAQPLKGCGIEELKLVATSTSGDAHMIKMEHCDSCWIKNIESSNIAGGAHVWTAFSYRCEIRHSFFHDSHTQAGGQGYGVALYHISTGFLVEDNIFKTLHIGMNVNYGSSGNVFAFNYEATGASDSGQNPGMNSHGVHCYMNLFEGNYAEDKVLADWTHGSSSHNTIFRCRITGNSPTAGGSNLADKRTCISIEYYNRYWNIVGNVLGTAGVQNKYLSHSGSTSTGSNGSILKIGGEVNINSDYSPSDAASYTSGSFVLIHGNYDTVQNTITYEPAVSDHAIPNSLYLAGKPAFFGNLAWPAFDPGLPGSATASNIPAGYRYINGSDPAPGSGVPAAPSNLQATP